MALILSSQEVMKETSCKREEMEVPNSSNIWCSLKESRKTQLHIFERARTQLRMLKNKGVGV